MADAEGSSTRRGAEGNSWNKWNTLEDAEWRLRLRMYRLQQALEWLTERNSNLVDENELLANTASHNGLDLNILSEKLFPKACVIEEEVEPVVPATADEIRAFTEKKQLELHEEKKHKEEVEKQKAKLLNQLITTNIFTDTHDVEEIMANMPIDLSQFGELSEDFFFV